MTMVETVADRYSGLRVQRRTLQLVQATDRLRFVATMRAATGHHDCPSCLWPDGLQIDPGCFPPACTHRWHWTADGVLAGLRGMSAPSKSAVVSPDDRYRYELYRRWLHDGLTVCWVMLNPSTADMHVDDATIRRIVAFSKAWGFGALVVRNLYALRATDPKMLRAVPQYDAVGPDNEKHLLAAADEALTVCAWGDNADVDLAAWAVRQLRMEGATLATLGRTVRGNPRHPVRLAGSTPLQDF